MLAFSSYLGIPRLIDAAQPGGLKLAPSASIHHEPICMSNVTRLPPHSRTLHVEADIPTTQRDEFDQAIIDIIAGKRPRMDALIRDTAAITERALDALQVIETAIKSHPTTGSARRLVKFLAGVYNGQDYPFDLTELRGLDTTLANACLDYLNYDRLGIKEVHKHLSNGDRDLHRWLADYGIEPAARG
jgi:hypothetical protein